MAHIRRTALVSHSADQMYALVNDVASYPRFLPWCSGARVLSDDGDEMRASIDLSLKGIQKTFTTCNRLQPHKMIEVRLVEGPFRSLEGFWRFDTLDDRACRVTVDLEYEFSSRLLGLALGSMFHHVAGTLLDAFCKRAREVYGQS